MFAAGDNRASSFLATGMNALGRMQDPNFHVQVVQLHGRDTGKANIVESSPKRGVFERLAQGNRHVEKSAATRTQMTATFKADERAGNELVGRPSERGIGDRFRLAGNGAANQRAGDSQDVLFLFSRQRDR